MSPETGLDRLPGRITCAHRGNFSPVFRNEFKKHNQGPVYMEGGCSSQAGYPARRVDTLPAYTCHSSNLVIEWAA